PSCVSPRINRLMLLAVSPQVHDPLLCRLSTGLSPVREYLTSTRWRHTYSDETFLDVADGTGERLVFLQCTRHLLNGVHHRRVITTGEVLSDLRIGVGGQFAYQVHGHLPRDDQFLPPALPAAVGGS